MGRVRVRVPTYRNRVVIFVLTVSGLCLDALFFLVSGGCFEAKRIVFELCRNCGFMF